MPQQRHDLAALAKALQRQPYDCYGPITINLEYPDWIAVDIEPGRDGEISRHLSIGDCNGPTLALQEHTNDGSQTLYHEDLHIEPTTSPDDTARRIADRINARINMNTQPFIVLVYDRNADEITCHVLKAPTAELAAAHFYDGGHDIGHTCARTLDQWIEFSADATAAIEARDPRCTWCNARKSEHTAAELETCRALEQLASLG